MVEVTDTPPKLVKTKTHTIEAVIDRLVIREGIRPRLAESLDLALKLADGRVLALVETPAAPPSPAGWDERLLSIHLACPACGTSLPEIEPRSFSFNSPHGACPACDGLGSRGTFQAELSVPDRSRSWSQGAVIPWTLLAEGQKDTATLEAPVRDFLTRHHLDADAPMETWPAPAWQSFWHGEPGGPFAGLAAMLERGYQESRSEGLRRSLDAYREPVVCPSCDGSRLRPEARAVRFGGRPIRELTAMAVGDLLPFVRTMSRPPMAALVARASSPCPRDPPMVATRPPRRSPRPCSPRSRGGSSTWLTSGWNTCRWTGDRTRSPAASSSGRGWRRSSARGWWGSATSWTSRRPGCIRATPRG